MDLKINRINFQGKNEVLYGLKKAANEVHSYSLGIQPRLLRLGENTALKNHEIAAKAYLDMVTNDSCFEEFVTSTGEKCLQKSFKQYFEPIEDSIFPLEHFSQFLQDVMDKKRMFSVVKRNAATNLIKRLSEL